MADFFREGGPVLWVLFSLGVVLMLLIVERASYVWGIYRPIKRDLHGHLERLPHPYVRVSQLGDTARALQEGFPLIKCLIGLCPLVGLLGTVCGMIAVFDTLAIQGSGNARLLAAGVARTIYPTLTGMSLAVLALLLLHPLEHYWLTEQARLDRLKWENLHAPSTRS
ncbi:MAG: MotA/TolQ/ExbB proton channel family protein [Hahellaceae bacterium]|nr:MotA/TolQ/ExbB proton channel family protein [Hahellaceae bacterium]